MKISPLTPFGRNDKERVRSVEMKTPNHNFNFCSLNGPFKFHWDPIQVQVQTHTQTQKEDQI